MSTSLVRLATSNARARDRADIAPGAERIRRGALPRFDRELVDVIGDLRGWLDRCAALGTALVAFYC
jgi:hypothetical protein